MTRFFLVAALMAAIAAAAVAYPLWRDARSRLVGLGAAVAVAASATALYPLWSNFDWHAPVATPAGQRPDVAAMVGKLERHLAEQPDDQEGWIMLGRSYGVMERVDDSIVAYRKAVALGASVDATVGLAEALSVREGGEIAPEASQLFEQALKLAPDNPKALFYGGYAALLHGDRATARARWVALKNLHPPAQIEQLLDARIAELDQPGGGTNASDPGTSASAEVSAPAEVAVNIALAPALKARVKDDTPLFVFAREPGVQGPPLAARRLTAGALATQVTLSSADSMMPGRALQAGQRVSITARLSFSGAPTPAAGDLYGETVVEIGQRGAANVVIDKIAP